MTLKLDEANVSEEQKNSSNWAEQWILGTSKEEEPKLVPFLKTRIKIGPPLNIAFVFQNSPNLSTRFLPLEMLL